MKVGNFSKTQLLRENTEVEITVNFCIVISLESFCSSSTSLAILRLIDTTHYSRHDAPDHVLTTYIAVGYSDINIIRYATDIKMHYCPSKLDAIYSILSNFNKAGNLDFIYLETSLCICDTSVLYGWGAQRKRATFITCKTVTQMRVSTLCTVNYKSNPFNDISNRCKVFVNLLMNRTIVYAAPLYC